MAKRSKTVRRGGTAADIVDDQDGAVTANDDIAREAWKNWKRSRDHLKDWRPMSTTCFDIVAGHQWTTEEEASLKEQLRPVVTFNRTGVICDSVSGYEINNRQDIAFLPRTMDDTGPVQVESEAGKYFRQQCDAEDEESDSFYDLLVCGLGVVEHHMDYDDDPEGMLKVERTDPLEMGYDPAAIKRNLSDRRWDIRGKWWDEKVAKAKFPDHEFDAANNIAGDTDDLNDSKPIDREAAVRYSPPGQGEQYDAHKGKVFILEYTWFESEPFVSAINPTSGKLEDLTPEKLKAGNEKLVAAGMEPLKSVKRVRKVFKRAFVHGPDTLNLKDLEAPCPHRFHYQFMTGKRDRNKNIWFGLVRAMKDPQEWANKFMSQTMHMINANAKGGLIHEEGAFERPQDIEKQMAKPGWRLQTRNGYGDKVKFVPPTGIPNNTFDLMQFAVGSVRDTTGVNVELLGLADRDQPGVLENARKQSAMAILAPFFDALRRYRKEAGRLTLYFIKEYLSDGRLIRITGEGKAQYVPLTKVGDFNQYDVIVDQSPTSPDAKRALFSILMQVLPALMKQGMPMPPELLDYIPDLPAELAQKWKEMLQPKDNPQAEAAAALEMADKKADVEKKQSEVMLNETKAAAEMAAIVPMLQQIMAGMGLISAAVPGGPEVGAPAGPAPAGPAPQAPAPAPMAGPPAMPPQEMGAMPPEMPQEMPFSLAPQMMPQPAPMPPAAPEPMQQDQGGQAMEMILSLGQSIERLAAATLESSQNLAAAVLADSEIVRDGDGRAVGSRRVPRAVN